MNEEMKNEAVEELYRKIGFYGESVFFVETRPLASPALEAIRRAADGKWQERPVEWKTIVEWVGQGCPEPISGRLTLPSMTGPAKERAVEFVGPVFERSEERLRGKGTEWVVHGYDGTDPLVDERVTSQDLGPGAINELLRRLACRHLTEAEIIAASTGGIAHLELTPTKDGLMTQGNPHYVAVRIDPED